MQHLSTSGDWKHKVMKVKSKLLAAVSLLKDHAAINRAMVSNQNILSTIEVAILRCTDRQDASADDKYVHEILFIVSNAPGSITFLARRISTRMETARDPVVALKTLVLLHRLLRGGDRYFEQDLRNLWSSRDLRMNLPWCNPHPFLLNYSMFLEERMGWIINQSGMLEPIRPPCSELQSYEEDAAQLVLHRLSRCQTFLDRIMGCLPDSVFWSSPVAQSAINIILRESFRVYGSFCEGLETMVTSFVGLKKPFRVLALDVLKKACIQTSGLHEFYENCKRSIDSKALDYPVVRIITNADISSIELFLPAKCSCKASIASEDRGSTACEAKAVTREALSTPFSQKLETRISTVWVEFGEEDSQTSGSSVMMC